MHVPDTGGKCGTKTVINLLSMWLARARAGVDHGAVPVKVPSGSMPGTSYCPCSFF